MDASEYRRQYAAELERAAQQQPTFQDLLENSRAAAPREMATAEAVAPQDDDDLPAAVAVLRDDGADEQLRSAALQIISFHAPEHPELIDTLLELLRDADAPENRRTEILKAMQRIDFRMALLPAKRADYLATLRSIIDDPGTKLRQRAIGILAREKDEYVQRRLLEGLEDPSEALVPPEKAIQALSYDVHAEYFPLLRRMVEDPPNDAARKEAVRLLAADPSSTDLLLALLNDKRESSDVRTTSAIALQAVAPTEFQEQARRVVLDDDEDDQLRAVSISALSHFANPTALREDAELTRRVEQLGAESASQDVQKASEAYMSASDE
jgi:hypothetical protein